MILTVTINPLLERRLSFKRINHGSVNRSEGFRFYAGGKGINVSRQLNKFEIPNIALTILGGQNGKNLRRILAEDKIQFKAVNTKSETRTATLTLDNKKEELTTFIEPNPEISEKEAGEFLDQLKKMIPNSSMIIFSGSSPSKTTDNIFAEAIKTANELDKVTILDTYGAHLSNCINAAPMILHNNLEEAESYTKLNLKEEEQKLNYLDSLYSKGIKIALLSDGKNPLYALKFGFKYKIIPPRINLKDPVGSGDSFMAGLIYGMHNNLVFEESLRIAAASGALNASSWETADGDKEKILELSDSVKVESIGKKMKIIDDSPNY